MNKGYQQANGDSIKIVVDVDQDEKDFVLSASNQGFTPFEIAQMLDLRIELPLHIKIAIVKKLRTA